jgi:hypothetical protein
LIRRHASARFIGAGNLTGALHPASATIITTLFILRKYHMGIYVPDRPAMTQLSDHVVGRPVSQRHGAAWRDTLHFLLGANLPQIASFYLRQASGSPRTCTFAYKRSPGARALAVFVELHDVNAANLTCTVSLSRSGGAISFLPDSVVANGDLRAGVGARPLSPLYGTYADRAQFADVIDVSGLTVGALEWITLTWTDGPAVGTTGMCRVHVLEVPRRDIAVDSSDAGVDGAWPFAGNGLYDGDGATDTDGFKRFSNEIARARNKVKRHIQQSTLEHLTDGWISAPSVGAYAAVLFNKSMRPSFQMRARRLYETSVANPYKFVCRYSTQSGTKTVDLKVTATSRGAGTVATATLTLAANAAFQASAEATLNVPTDGTDQEVFITLDHKDQAGANLVLSNWALIEDEA